MQHQGQRIIRLRNISSDAVRLINSTSHYTVTTRISIIPYQGSVYSLQLKILHFKSVISPFTEQFAAIRIAFQDISATSQNISVTLTYNKKNHPNP